MLWTKVSSTNVRAVVMTAEKNDVLFKRLPVKSASKVVGNHCRPWEITSNRGKIIKTTRCV